MSGPMGEGPLPEEERNVVPETDDEELDEEKPRFIEHGATHFSSRFRPNQREYPGRPRGTARGKD